MENFIGLKRVKGNISCYTYSAEDSSLEACSVCMTRSLDSAASLSFLRSALSELSLLNGLVS